MDQVRCAEPVSANGAALSFSGYRGAPSSDNSFLGGRRSWYCAFLFWFYVAGRSCCPTSDGPFGCVQSKSLRLAWLPSSSRCSNTLIVNMFMPLDSAVHTLLGTTSSKCFANVLFVPAWRFDEASAQPERRLLCLLDYQF